jgi:hypothetical protein
MDAGMLKKALEKHARNEIAIGNICRREKEAQADLD